MVIVFSDDRAMALHTKTFLKKCCIAGIFCFISIGCDRADKPNATESSQTTFDRANTSQLQEQKEKDLGKQLLRDANYPDLGLVPLGKSSTGSQTQAKSFQSPLFQNNPDSGFLEQAKPLESPVAQDNYAQPLEQQQQSLQNSFLNDPYNSSGSLERVKPFQSSFLEDKSSLEPQIQAKPLPNPLLKNSSKIKSQSKIKQLPQPSVKQFQQLPTNSLPKTHLNSGGSGLFKTKKFN